MTTLLRRYTGALIGEFGAPLGIPCTWPHCNAPAVLLPCNAEGDVGRAHHWGGVHARAGGPGGNLCETHGLRVLAANATIREEA